MTKLAAGCLVFNDAGHMLVFLRARDGAYGLPFGKAGEDESPQEAAIRETCEETGYAVELLAEDPFVAMSTDGQFECYTFRAKIKGEGQPMCPWEGSATWMTPSEFMQKNQTCSEYNVRMAEHFKILEQI